MEVHKLTLQLISCHELIRCFVADLHMVSSSPPLQCEMVQSKAASSLPPLLFCGGEGRPLYAFAVMAKLAIFSHCGVVSTLLAFGLASKIN